MERLAVFADVEGGSWDSGVDCGEVIGFFPVDWGGEGVVLCCGLHGACWERNEAGSCGGGCWCTWGGCLSQW